MLAIVSGVEMAVVTTEKVVALVRKIAEAAVLQRVLEDNVATIIVADHAEVALPELIVQITNAYLIARQTAQIKIAGAMVVEDRVARVLAEKFVATLQAVAGV